MKKPDYLIIFLFIAVIILFFYRKNIYEGLAQEEECNCQQNQVLIILTTQYNTLDKKVSSLEQSITSLKKQLNKNTNNLNQINQSIIELGEETLPVEDEEETPRTP